MKKITNRLVSWASILGENAEEQARTTATMPFIYPHLALMPDAHLGLGATVGSVIPTLRAVMPAAVGVDIGCGMIAVKTAFTKADIDRITVETPLRELREQIERAVPTSAGAYNRKLVATAEPRVADLQARAERAGFDPTSYAGNWMLQLGTLGSGNHFIEVSLDETDAVWLFLHSGSRGVGNKIAQHHIKVAKAEMERWWITLPDPDLAYLVEGTPQFHRYIEELRWAQHFALLNREEMMDRVVRQLSEWMGEPVVELERVNCHHNFTQLENHFGKDVWLSRKGAISARLGEPGLIPGSMGTASYVVAGLGNPLALESSPHGAGREFSRSAARKTFTHEQLREAMTGIEFRDTGAFLDEIPAAYKDIDQVMADASDLVRIVHTLRQIVNVKGD
jgi:tRNA-splicing ligase RtcB